MDSTQPTNGNNGNNGRSKTAREVAGDCLQRGYQPIPVPFRSKKPVLEAWEDLRPTSADLDTLFPPDRPLNVGLLLGTASRGLVDVDLDVVEAIGAASAYLPRTGWVSGRQSKPRSHHWYTTDDPPDKAQTIFKDLDGTMILELRSTGAQTIFWGEHESGERINWQETGGPAHAHTADLFAACHRLAAAALFARHWPSEGSRDEAAMALTGGLTRAGWNGDEVSTFCRAVAVAAGDEEAKMRSEKAGRTAEKMQAGKKATGWPRLGTLLAEQGPKIVQRALEWLGITTRSQAKPTPPPAPYQPFPVEALPEPVRSFVVQGAAALGCDPIYLAAPALSIVASLIGNSREVKIKRDWHEPSVIWSAIIGDSGTLKSPALKMVAGPLYRIQKELIERYKREAQQYQKDKADYDQWAKDAKKAGKPFKEDAPEKPSLIRIVTSDVTIEKLAVLLEDNSKGLVLCRDELGGWLTSFQRYKGKVGGTDLPGWLEMHRAETLVVDRKSGDRPTLFIPRAAVSVCGGIQEGTLGRALTVEHFEAGLAARLLMGMPPKKRKQWTEAEVDPDTRQAYEAVLRKLLDLTMDKDEKGEKVPFAVWLTPEAKERWVAFYQEWAKEQAGAEGEVAACLSKLEGYAARLALVHHVVTNVLDMADCDPIGPESIEAGIALTRWFAYEAKRIYVALREPEESRQVRRLFEFIRCRGGTITVRRLHKSNTSRYGTAEAAEVALDALATAGLAEWVELPPGPKGGRPSRALRLLAPKPDETVCDGDEDEDDDAGSLAPKPHPKPPAPCGNSSVLDVSSGFGASGTNLSAPKEDRDAPPGAEGVLSVAPGDVLSSGAKTGAPASLTEDEPRTQYSLTHGDVTYHYVRDEGGLGMAIAAVDDSTRVAIDTETTGLDQRRDRVRLLTMAPDRDRMVYVVDCYAVDPAPLIEALDGKQLIVHNAAFDLGFLWQFGYRPSGPIHDLMILSRLLTAGTMDGNSLADIAHRERGISLEKAHQRDDWSQSSLSAEQLGYAAMDARVTADLHPVLLDKVREANLDKAAMIEREAIPAFLWISAQGAPFNRQAWEALTIGANREAESLREQMDAVAPPREGRLIAQGAWNWDSPADVLKGLQSLSFTVESTNDETLATIDHPLATLLRRYRGADKLVSTYGKAWLEHEDGGRIYARWVQLGTDAGRSACKKPNLQQVPRDKRYRQCFVAPDGKVLVKADYSQLQLRIAAKMADEKKMLAAYAEGKDLHTITAQSITGKTVVTKHDRQLAKAVNFGLLFGLGAKGLQGYAKGNYDLDLTLEEAERYRAAFFEAYPGLAAWHSKAGRSLATECRTIAGRRRLLHDKTPFTHRLNTPVQGAEADGAKLAMALLWERRDQCGGAVPVLFCHDEIVVEVDTEKANAAAEWLRQAMLDAMGPLLKPVPCEVEVTLAQSWGG
jgi:DNA polymerase I-like protein with 3'-5' exonuclease and polymerase domains